jgi:hypothetical protein
MTIFGKQVLIVILVMNSFCIENLSKLMDKLVAHIIGAKYNQHKIFKKKCNTHGTTNQSNDGPSFGNANLHFLPK